VLTLASSLPLASSSSEIPHKETASVSSALEGLLRPEELAQQLDISLRTLARWHSRRTGPPRIRVGRATYYDVFAVRQWLRARNECGSPNNERRRSTGIATRR
jgi:predicted DNA-binding transcriptional regulator AlpA